MERDNGGGVVYDSVKDVSRSIHASDCFIRVL